MPHDATPVKIEPSLSPATYRSILAGVSDGFFVGEAIRDPVGRMTDFRFLEFNAAFEALTGLSFSAAHLQPVSVALPGVPEELIALYAQVVDTGEAARFEIQIPVLERRWFEARASKVGEDRFAVLFIDITSRIAEQENLEKNADGLRAIIDFVDQMIWSTRPDGYHDFYNARWYEFTGVPEGSTDGEAWNGMFHPEDQERAWALWRHCLNTGEPYEIEYRLRHRSGTYRWVLGRAHPIRDSSGAIVRWMGTCTDIHDQKLTAERLELLNEELSHRIKNVFTVVDGLIQLSLRQGDGAGRLLADQVSQRINALAKAQKFARPMGDEHQPPPATLFALLHELLDPYRSGARVSIFGSDAPLNPGVVTALALVIHELATNAAKYGSLSTPTGAVEVEAEHNKDDIHIVWRELGGPMVAEPSRQGFGSRLVAAAVRDQLKGRLTQHWRPEGLCVELDFPRG